MGALTYGSGDALNMSDSVYGFSPVKITLNVAAAPAGTLMLGRLSMALPEVRFLRWLGTHTLPIVGFNYRMNAAVVHALDSAHANHWLLSFVIHATLLAAIARAIDHTGMAGDLINVCRRQPHRAKRTELSQT